MTLFRTGEPEAEPVTLAGVKAHLRLDHDSEDGLLSGLIRAARDEVERATGTALINQTWRLALDRWPRNGCVLLARHPVRSVLSVTVYGPDGEASLLPPAAYQFDPLSRPARVTRTNRHEDALKRAILMLATHWYEFRGVLGPEKQPASYPPGYERLIAGYQARKL